MDKIIREPNLLSSFKLTKTNLEYIQELRKAFLINFIKFKCIIFFILYNLPINNFIDLILFILIFLFI